MYLKSLELSGFKSFAKKCELSFGTAISAIVGPNGSGKSNIAEAFRFVLGEQSIKSLRGKKGEDLIFNGGGDVGRANRASVKIVFDNSKRFLDLDFDEVSLERVVYRDGINEYLINGSAVRLRDVLELMAGAHISSSGHHIISQGEADRILNANTKERKSMIEGALGLKVYQYKREESERKLAKTEENIKSVESLRREILPHLKFLKKQVEKVEKALEMKNRLLSLYKEYLKRESIYLSTKKQEIENERRPIDKELKDLEAGLSHAKEILRKSANHDSKSSKIVELEEKIRKIRIEKDKLMRDLGRIEGEISSGERLLKRQKELSHTLPDKAVAIADVEELIEKVEFEVEKIAKNDNPTFLQKILDEIKDLLHSFVHKHKSKSSDGSLGEIESDLEKLRHEKSSIEKEIKNIDREDKESYEQYKILERDIEKEKDTNRDAEKKVFEIMSLQNEAISRLNISKSLADKIRLEEENFKRELGEAGVLIGREVLDFERFEVLSEDSVKLDTKEIARENRSFQENRRREIEKIKIRIEDSGALSSDETLKEYKDVSDRDAFLASELSDLEKSALSLRKLIGDLEQKINTEFKTGIDKINRQFEEFFSLMFGGGSASLEIVKEKRRPRSDTDISSLLEEGPDIDVVPEGENSETIEGEEEGVDISVSLPRKKIKGLMMLSGGERALTSIALIFAISQVNPPPFIILDETDAALDEANSKKYGDMIENLAKLSQLILITHNRETMSRAGILYGVTMIGGVSKILSIKFEEAVTVAK